MTSPASSSERLHPAVLRWIHRQGWTALREIQERAIPAILDGERDVLLVAGTASGKTEAAFFPLLTRVLARPADGVRVLCVSPLRALIDDQTDRLELLCAEAALPVHRWHGDVAGSRKEQVLEEPAGILVITPESLEAMLALRGAHLPRLFAGLERVVIDEVHTFIGGERGAQLGSLLRRVEARLGRTVPRVGLSATIGDVGLAAEFLRPGGSVVVVQAASGGHEVAVSLRAVGSLDEACDHLYDRLRGGKHLVFAPGRGLVEEVAGRLRARCAREGVPDEFRPHHGSLSVELRDEAEERLRGPLPATVVCTSTLEMGIDVGGLTSVAQLGLAPSVASLRQRLGRSGRRGMASTLRQLLIVDDPPSDAPHRQILPALVEGIAALSLLLQGWVEPPARGARHLSTLVQQIISVISERGGIAAGALFDLLEPALDRAAFATLLRALGAADVLVQAGDGDLLLGLQGEKLLGDRGFFAAFATPREVTLVAGGRSLGTVPLRVPLVVGARVRFGGRTWRITGADPGRREVHLSASAPPFHGAGPAVHDRIRQEMHRLYVADERPAFLNEAAAERLATARAAFHRHGLAERALVGELVFPWAGDRVLATLAAALRARQVEATVDGVALRLEGDARAHLRALRDDPPTDAAALSAHLADAAPEKHDHLLGPLLPAERAGRALDLDQTLLVLARLPLV
jgi:ATP-dependent helicase Lhr and Lhr-like helicase